MAQWKKVIVSGSNVSDLSHIGSGLLSGSAQIAANISGSSNALSASVAADIAALDSIYATDSAVSASVSAVNSAFIEADVVLSSSLAADIAQNASDIAGLDSIYATDAAVSASVSALNSAFIEADNALSSSLAADIAALDGNFATDAELSALSGAIAADIADLDSIYATDSELSAVSSSIASQISGLDATAIINNSGTPVLASGISETEIRDLIGLGTSASPTFANVVITGDLDVQGDVSTLNTTNLAIEDKYILLNSGSAGTQEGGIVIDQGQGEGHAFIFESGSNRFGFNALINATGSSATPEAFAAAVIDISAGHSDSVEYQKAGNIKVDSNGDIYIFS